MRCYANETGAYNCDFSHLKTVMKDLFVKEEVVSGYIQALSHLISFQRLVFSHYKGLVKRPVCERAKCCFTGQKETALRRLRAFETNTVCRGKLVISKCNLWLASEEKMKIKLSSLFNCY